MHAYERILVPVDFSSASVQAAKRAVQLAPAMGHVELLHVAQVPLPVIAPPTEMPLEETAATLDLRQTQALLESELRTLHELVQPLNPEVHVDSHVVYGDPESVIVDESKNYDLIVVGAKHRSRISRMLIGSVASRAVKEAVCPVLVERDTE